MLPQTLNIYKMEKKMKKQQEELQKLTREEQKNLCGGVGKWVIRDGILVYIESDD